MYHLWEEAVWMLRVPSTVRAGVRLEKIEALDISCAVAGESAERRAGQPEIWITGMVECDTARTRQSRAFTCLHVWFAVGMCLSAVPPSVGR